MWHTFLSCLIRCANMKWIRRVLLKIQSGHVSVHRQTDGSTDRWTIKHMIQIFKRLCLNCSMMGFCYHYHHFEESLQCYRSTALCMADDDLEKGRLSNTFCPIHTIADESLQFAPSRYNPGGLNIIQILCISKPENLTSPQATLPFKLRLLRIFQATET